MPAAPYTGQVVWITGASSGVGEGLAHAFAEAGARVVLSARRADELERVRAALPGTGHAAVPMDVTDLAALPGLVEQVRTDCGRIDVLVANAGVSQRSGFTETDFAVFRKIIDVNLLGVAAHLHAVLPVLRAQGDGHLVVTSSVAGKFGIPNRSAYCASKHAVHGLCDALRAELAHEGIRVSTLVIAAVKSQVNANAFTADGGKVGKSSRWGYSGGLDARVAGRRMVAALARGEPEITVVPNWRAALPLWQQRLWPALVHRRMAKLARSKWWA